jgi:hypothetical protein
MKTLVFAAVCVTSISVQGQSALDRQVGSGPGGRDIAVVLPIVDGFHFQLQLLTVSHLAGVPVGLERLKDEPLPPGVRIRPDRTSQTKATGRRVGEIVDLLLSNAPLPRRSSGIQGHQFERTEGIGIVHVKPFRARSSFLDQVIPQFDFEGSPRSAVAMIHRHLDPAYPVELNALASSTVVDLNSRQATTNSATLFKTIRLSLKNATIRDILDAIVLAAAEMSWCVEYAGDYGDYTNATIGLVSFGGEQLRLGARRR